MRGACINFGDPPYAHSLRMDFRYDYSVVRGLGYSRNIQSLVFVHVHLVGPREELPVRDQPKQSF